MPTFNDWLQSVKSQHRWNAANRARLFQALEKRRDADRQERIGRIVVFIAPAVLSIVIMALWLWLGQR
jgi:hypothetical protein